MGMVCLGCYFPSVRALALARGEPEMHKGCKAQKCVRSGESQYMPVQLPDHKAVEGSPDFFIHVTVDASLTAMPASRSTSAPARCSRKEKTKWTSKHCTR